MQHPKIKIQKVIKIFKFCIVILTFAFCLLNFENASAATIYSGSATQVVYEGQSFVVDWYINTEGENLNTIDLKLNYTTDTLSVSETSIGNSLVSLWIKSPVYDNEKGTIELIGGVPNGFNGEAAPIFRATFVAKKTGNAKISLASGSTVLRNDGRGTSDTVKSAPLEFPVVDQSLQPVVLLSPSHPDQNTWYRERDVKIRFDVKSGTDYSFSFSSNAELFPDDQREITNGILEYNNMPDGLYYFKLHSKVGTDTWQEAGVYRVQIDTTPPESFKPVIGSDPNIFSGKSFLSFSTLDKTSGISHYYVKRGLLGMWEKAKSPYELKKPIVGRHISVMAIDNAGNKRVEKIEYKGWVPVWLFIILLAMLAVLSWFGYRKLKLKK